jgi:lipoate-protein ligase A
LRGRASTFAVTAAQEPHNRIPAVRNFLEDERQLRDGVAGVRAAVLSDRSLSIGVAVRGEPDYVRRGRDAGLPIVRRSSGGSGVLHLRGDLVWSVVLPRSDPRVGRDYARAYGRLGRGVLRFFRDRGVAATWAPAPGLVEEYCVLSSRGEVLTVGAGVLGGAAQHATARALLHQGMIARRVDADLIERVFGVVAPDLRSRLIGTEDLGIVETPEALAAALRDALAEEFLGPRSGGRAGSVRP